MPPDDDDGQQQQREHARMFSSGTEEESRPEDRYDPVVVDLDAEEPKKGEQAPDTGAKELRAQLAQQRNATQQAQQIAMEASQRAQLAEQRAIGSTVSMIDSALEAANQQAANFKAEFQAALDAADHRAAAEAQEKLSDARHNLLRLQEQRAYVEAESRRPPPQQRQQPQPQQRQQVNGVEDIAQSLINDGYPRSADWLRAHPEWTARPDLMKRVASASNHLVDNKGFVADTDEYFAALEQELGMSQRQRADYGQARRAPAASAAPTSSSVSLRTGQPVMRSHIPLNPEQRAAALEMHGMTEKEFAQEFEKARVEGKLIGYR